MDSEGRKEEQTHIVSQENPLVISGEDRQTGKTM